MTRRPPRSERGAALLTAMIIVTLVASLAAAMVWRQYRAVQIESAERARAQSAWILQGALDWARLILREDARANRRQTEATDHLGEVWAVPLAEARLSTFLAADKNSSSEDDGPEAFLSGTIEDAQSRYNLRNLRLGGEAVDPKEKRTLEQLCDGAGAPPGTANLIITKMRGAFADEPDKATAALRPRNIDQLAWFGLTPEAIERLRPLVILLPHYPTKVNVNTAPREVLAALFEGMDLASAERLVQTRQTNPFKALAEIQKHLPPSVKFESESSRASVSSDYFIVGGKLRLEDRILEERSLVQRKTDTLEVTVLQRQRVSQIVTTR